MPESLSLAVTTAGVRQADGTIKAEFSAPAYRIESPITTSGCDCFYHRRIFAHAAMGPARDDDSHTLPLARTIRRTDYSSGLLHWRMEMRIDGAVIRAYRVVVPGSGLGPLPTVQFAAWARIGDRDIELERMNPHAVNSVDRQDGAPSGRIGDPTLIFRMPGDRTAAGRGQERHGHRLVIWPEAWWWHLLGCQRCGRAHVDPLDDLDEINGDAFACGGDGRDILSLPSDGSAEYRQSNFPT